MHYHAEVWVPDKENYQQMVETIMAPYEESQNENGFWDWWQIGGRWKGAHVPGYNSHKDPAHLVTCQLCHGTGRRPDADTFDAAWLKWSHGCNGCMGTGKEVLWPTEWQPHELDIIPVSEIDEKLTAATVILPESPPWHDDRPFVESAGVKVKKLLEAERVKAGYMVTVDYHS